MNKEKFVIGTPLYLSFEETRSAMAAYVITGLDAEDSTVEVSCSSSHNGQAIISIRQLDEIDETEFRFLQMKSDGGFVPAPIWIHRVRKNENVRMTWDEFRTAIERGVTEQKNSNTSSISTKKPLYLSFDEDDGDYVIETTVLAVNMQEGVIIVVDSLTGRTARIRGFSEETSATQSLRYEVYNSDDNSVTDEKQVWVDLGL